LCTTRGDSIDGGTRNPNASPLPGHLSSDRSHAGDDAASGTLLLELAGLALDVAGIFDPTPVSDGASALLSVSQGHWGDAAISVVAMVPYVGDLAKAGKLPRYLRILEHVIERARQSARFAERAEPYVLRLGRVLDRLPDGTNAIVDTMKRLVREFQAERKIAHAAAELPDISQTFRFGRYERGDRVYKEAAGRLGVPGRVKTHRSPSGQRAVSRGTGDDAGHLIGDRFGAPGTGPNLSSAEGPGNLSLQNRTSNQYGTYHDLEDAWAEKLQHGTGVEVRVTDVFRRGETRPFMRRAEWTEIAPDGGRTTHSLDFMNTHTPLSRQMQNVPPTQVPPGGGQVIDRSEPGFWRGGR
jgi:hypothetical protein